jgi:hypothetical protein
VKLAIVAIVFVACGHTEPTREPIANTAMPIDAAPAPLPCTTFFEAAQRVGHCTQLDTQALKAIMQAVVELLGREHTQADCTRGLDELEKLAGSAASACSL